jgi:hypothetical protein
MKSNHIIITIVRLAYKCTSFKGNGDVKGQVGLNLQDGGTGILFLLILNENMSLGLRLIIYYLLTKTNWEIFQILDNGRFESTI